MNKSTIIDYDALSNLSDESLSELLSSGIIKPQDAEAIKEIIMAKNLKRMKELVLEVHHHKISEPNPNGRYKTRIDVYDPITHELKQKQLVKSSEYDFYEALCEHYRIKVVSVSKTITIANLYPDWLEYKRLHTNAPTYITRIDSDWKRYYEGTKIVNTDIRSISKLDMDEWVHRMIKDYSMTKTAYYNMSVIMRQVLAYAVDKEIILANPLDSVTVDARRMFRKQKKNRPEEEVFSKTETQEIFKLAIDDYNHNEKLIYKLSPLAVMFQFQTGLRVGELCGVKFNDIEGDYIHIQRMVRDHPLEVVEKTKTDDGDRMVYLTSKAKVLIEEARKYSKSEYIFSMIAGEPLKPRIIHDRYDTYCKTLGINHKSSHKARKTYNSTLLDAGVNIDSVRRMMGHSDEHTTLKNYTFDRSEKKIRESIIEKALI